jgi:hypothetical protein
MAIPQVTLPVPFDQIPAEVKRLSEHARGLQLEREMVLKLIDAVRTGCDHAKAEHWTDRAGEPSGNCPHCGYTW